MASCSTSAAPSASARDVLGRALTAVERGHLDFAQEWIASGASLFRVEKPAKPDPHLVAYFVLLDLATKKVLLVDHKNAELWLPAGGHVEPNEHPKETVRREIVEELGTIGSPFGQEVHE